MKILELREVPVPEKASVKFIRIDPEDISTTLAEILEAIMDLSWLKDFDADFVAQSFKQRAQITITDIKDKFAKCIDGKLTKDAGEYVVSETAREAIVSQLGYLDIIKEAFELLEVVEQPTKYLFLFDGKLPESIDFFKKQGLRFLTIIDRVV